MELCLSYFGRYPSFSYATPNEELAAYEAEHQKRRYGYKEKS
jgi:hypothetical protein